MKMAVKPNKAKRNISIDKAQRKNEDEISNKHVWQAKLK